MAKLNDLDLHEVTLAAYTTFETWTVKTHEAHSWQLLWETIPLNHEQRRHIYLVRGKYYMVADSTVRAPINHRYWFIRQLYKLPGYDTVEAAIAAYMLTKEDA